MLEHDKGVYDADMAHHRSRERACRPSRPKLQTDAELRAEVQAKLDLEWSPEQIAAHLRILWPDQPDRHLCHETIYGPSTRAPRYSASPWQRGTNENTNGLLRQYLPKGRSAPLREAGARSAAGR